mgnify:CR=1 FL=1
MVRRTEISTWLLVVASFIILIVLVGGITRLTQSGLSIVEWNLVTGVFPPLSQESWSIEFDKYKTSPEFQVINNNISFSDFKIIYFWEYFHRLLARLVGLIAVIPLLYFFIKKKIDKREFRIFLIIPFLILIQGVVGWMMVKSGLNIKTYNGIGVSHYWLSLHLFLALTTYSIVLWQYLRIKYPVITKDRNKMNYGFLIYLMIFAQIILGALLSGLDAGLITSNFPDINGEFYPEQSLVSLSNPYFLHFAHRWLPFLIMLICILFYNKVKSDLNQRQKGLFLILLFIFIIQMILGIMTVLTSVNISMAIMHQINAIVLLSVALIIAFSLSSK